MHVTLSCQKSLVVIDSRHARKLQIFSLSTVADDAASRWRNVIIAILALLSYSKTKRPNVVNKRQPARWART